MCGIAGFFTASVSSPEELQIQISRMAGTLNHRGPDDAGVWVDAEQGLALGHRRLAILDLSRSGHQPMASPTGRYVMIFNGEIYNHLELREQLNSGGVSEGNLWRGHSDTETLLAAFEAWGVEKTLRRSVGMFAIALWDRQARALHLARDRIGEKPLYYGWVNGSFVFGSELKAIRAYPGFNNPVCRLALMQYLRFTYVPAPRSIYQDIFKLEPGCLLSVSGVPPKPAEPMRPPATLTGLRYRRWWALGDAVVAGAEQPIQDETAAIDALEQTLSQALQQQALADVPLGAFLSGGVDSSVIVALMQQQSARPVQTFTVGFDASGFDESPYARAVARHLGTDHNELFVTSAEAREVIPRLPDFYDEPFADSSQIPTHLVCKAARRQVKVALSGDGGDELFGGYNRYFWGPRIWDRLAWLPFPIRQWLGWVMQAMPIRGWDAMAGPANSLRTGNAGFSQLGDRVHKLAHRLRHVQDLDQLYLSLVSEWSSPQTVVKSYDRRLAEPANLLADPLPHLGMDDPALRMMYRDTLTYLPDDILCKVDRAAMSVSLETRVPLLDHRVVELAWRLPLTMKIRDGAGKWALRQVLYRHVPRELIERPKAGFAIPVGAWLRGPLKDWAENLLDVQKIEAEGYFNPSSIRQAWKEHQSGRREWTPRLWAILMFQAWLSSAQKNSC